MYYCNCEPNCIHKGDIKKIKIGKEKLKVQICNNKKLDCTCKHRVSCIINVIAKY